MLVLVGVRQHTRSMSPQIRRGVVAAVLWTATVACLASSCGQPTSPTREDGLAFATYEPAGSGSDDALLPGFVAALDGCLVVSAEKDNTDTIWVPVFASRDDTPLDLAGGDNIEVGGSEAGSRQDDWDVPEACPSDGPFWLVAQPER